MSLFNLTGKVALITGASGALGSHMVRGLVEAGAKVAALDRTSPPDEIKQLIDKGQVKYYQSDVSSSSLVNAIDQAAKDFKKLDICVPAAGIVTYAKFLDTEESQISRILDINIKGVIRTVQHTAKYMKEAKYGNIVLIASISAHQACRQIDLPIYAMTKGAISSLTKPLAYELAPYNIRVNTISPGYMLTPMTIQEGETYVKNRDQAMLKRMGQPNELNGALIYLASDASSFTTGQDIKIGMYNYIDDIDYGC